MKNKPSGGAVAFDILKLDGSDFVAGSHRKNGIET
jgi:hypothetical protein